MSKKQLDYLKKHCPEIISQMNFTKLVEFGKKNPPKYEHREPTIQEIMDDKIKLNLN